MRVRQIVSLSACLLLSSMWPLATEIHGQSSPANSPSPAMSEVATSPSNSSSGRTAGQSTEITAVGCIANIFFTDSGEYILIGGNDNDIGQHSDDWVRIRGRLIARTGVGPPNLEVLSITSVSKRQEAILDPKLRVPSQWHTYSNDVGVRLSLPEQFNPVDENKTNYQLVPDFIKNDRVTHVLSYEIPQEIYRPQPYQGIERTRLQTEYPPRTDFLGGAFAVFVNPEITDAATCKKFGPQNEGDLSSRTINGFNYTVLDTINGPSEIDFFHTFQNGRCIEVNFDLEFARGGATDITCAIEDVDGDALENLLLSKISFFHPKAPTAATVR